MTESNTRARWRHAHQCHKCGCVTAIDDIDSRAIYLGVVICPQCETAGPINVAIVEDKS